MLKIKIVHTDGLVFFARAAIVSEGQNIIFLDNNGYKQRFGPPVPKRRQFSDLFSRARVLKREKNNEKGDLASEPSRFASLSEGEIQQILTERHSGKTKNWSVSTFKGKSKFFRFEIVQFKTRAFNRKIENQFSLCLIRLPRTITSDIVGRFSRRI